VGYGKMGGSFNYSDSKTNSNYASVKEQSGIMAGDGGFQVNVNGNTDLKGAVSGISGGTISVGSNQAQTALTGKAAATTVATLNRDVKTQQSTDVNGNATTTAVDSNGNNLAKNITPIFDQTKVQQEVNAQVQITQAFSQVAPKAVGDFATDKMNEINLKIKAAEALNDSDQINTLKTELEKWDEGGIYRVGLHTILGGLAGNLEGAIGAAGSQAAIPALIENINKLDIPSELKETLLVGVSTSIGALIGDSAGAVSAFNAVVNNCNAHDCLTQKWDKDSPGYHHYEVKSPALCNVSESGCMEAVQHELLCNSAPGQSQCAVVGQVVNQNLTGNNGITQYAPSTNMVVNGTNDGHLFNDGYVVRTINVDASGNVSIMTQGEGVNNAQIAYIPLPNAPLIKVPVTISAQTMAGANIILGYAIFYNIGTTNLNNIKSSLNPQLP
jgi:filamentous hemagglutinin